MPDPTGRARAERMYERLHGLRRAYGRCVPTRRKRPGQQKLEAKCWTEHKPVTVRLFQLHLAGRQLIGIVLITDEGTCYWGVIDIDVYDLDFHSLEADLTRLGLPLVIVKSKSGGAHLCLFTTEPVPAALMYSILKGWAKALGYPAVEIFPKQTRLEPGDDGSWVNLPYAGGDKSSRHAIADGKPLTVDQFLDLADRKAVSRAELEAIVPGGEGDVGDLFYEAPPCLQRLAKEGWAEDYRNQWLFDVGVYLRKRYGDDFTDELDKYNERLAQPLGHKEFAHVVKSLGKKPYNYKCRDEPICSVCDREVCLTRRFGVGNGGEPAKKEKEDESWFDVLERVLEEAQYERWHTPDKQPFVSLTIGKHREHMPVTSTLLRQFLVRSYFDEKLRPIRMEGLKAVIELLASQAVLDGPEYALSLRVAWHDGAVYWDLANEDREVVRIDADGWAIVTDPPVRFFRPPGMRPLPRPERGGTIEALRPFVTIRDPNDWRLLIGFLVGCLRPVGPYWQLHVHGTHGSAKSTLARIIVALIDSQSPPTRALSESERDLVIAAREAHLLAFDNVSGLPRELSDPLCRLSTGGGLGIRKLYSNDEQQRFDVARPVVLNGIPEVANRADLRDRTLLVELPAISDDQRKDEATFWGDFEAARPLILGALCDAVSCAIRCWDTTVLSPAPRMADAARWVTAAEPALGWEAGGFLTSYAAHRDESAKRAVENDMLASAVVELAGLDNYKVTATQLLRALGAIVGEDTRRQPWWPKGPQRLSNELRRLKPDLAKCGVLVDFGRGDDRWVFVVKAGRPGEPKTTCDDAM